jgi:adenylate kinase family enzyme
VTENLKNPPAPYLHELWSRISGLRCIVVVGLPGTGKSLLVREIAAAAGAANRCSTVMQWDVSRESWDSAVSAAGRYPEVDGVTHEAVRVAMGSWVREAVGDWFSHAEEDDLLIVEAPHIGGRFSELAHVMHDAAEASLRGLDTLFVLVAPTKELQLILKSQRAADMESQGEGLYERNNASPDLLDELTNSLRGPALEFGIESSSSTGYDPELYADLMQHVLRHRKVLLVRPDRLMEATGSVYSLGDQSRRLWATEEQIQRSLKVVESMSTKELVQHTSDWFRS